MGSPQLSASLRQAADDVARLAAPVCRGWRWLPAALVVGVLPFAGSYAFGVPGHQVVSALALTLLCLPLVREDRWAQGIGAMALAFLAHSVMVVALAACDAAGVAPLVPDAAAYWQKQLLWITTGEDPEYRWAAWVPAHVRLLGGTMVYSYTSLGALTFYEGFYEVDLMNFYTAQLLGRSLSQTHALAAGWHIWSLLRGSGYLFMTYEVISLALQHLIGRPLSTRHRRLWRWAVGLSLIVADGLAKAALLEAVRVSLFSNLQ